MTVVEDWQCKALSHEINNEQWDHHYNITEITIVLQIYNATVVNNSDLKKKRSSVKGNDLTTIQGIVSNIPIVLSLHSVQIIPHHTKHPDSVALTL